MTPLVDDDRVRIVTGADSSHKRSKTAAMVVSRGAALAPAGRLLLSKFPSEVGLIDTRASIRISVGLPEVAWSVTKSFATPTSFPDTRYPQASATTALDVSARSTSRPVQVPVLAARSSISRERARSAAASVTRSEARQAPRRPSSSSKAPESGVCGSSAGAIDTRVV